MHHSFLLLVSLAVTFTGVFTSPVGEYPVDITPSYPGLAQGPGFKLCMQNPIRYNSQHFICHDNEVICPILDQGSENPHPMMRCGESCFDDRHGSCENNKVIPGPPKRSWELGVDLAFAHHIQHAPDVNPNIPAYTTAEEDAAAAGALLTRYAHAFRNTDAAALYKRYNDAVTAEYLAAEQKREDDQYLTLEKRWRRSSMRQDPVVRVKQVWEPRQNTEQTSNGGTVENFKSRSSEVLSTGEEKVDVQEPKRRVVRLPIQMSDRPTYRMGKVREDAEEVAEKVAKVEEEEEVAEGFFIDEDGEEESDDDEEEEEYEEYDFLIKRNVLREFQQHMEELEKVLAAVV